MGSKIEQDSFVGKIIAMSSNIARRIVFSDGNDIRLAKALDIFMDYNGSRFLIIGDEPTILNNIKETGIKNTSNFQIIDPKKSNKVDEHRQIIMQAYKDRGKQITAEQLDQCVFNPSYWAGIMLKNNEADCAVGGTISSTGDLMRAVIYILGLAKGRKFLSAAAFMEIPDCIYGLNGKFLISDPAIIPKPTEEQLTDMAITGYETAKGIFESEPIIAMLSYSTKGSAKSDEIDMIRRVVDNVKRVYPDMKIDGELQFDAAVVPEVAAMKCPGSIVGGKANVLIFPDLNSANIGYKMVQRLAKAELCGMIVQGCAKPFNDLSRGSLVEDVVALTAMTLVQRKGMEDNGLIKD